jgi:hypothetical protein
MLNPVIHTCFFPFMQRRSMMQAGSVRWVYMMHGKPKSGTAPISLNSPSSPKPPRESSRKACRTRVCCLYMWNVSMDARERKSEVRRVDRSQGQGGSMISDNSVLYWCDELTDKVALDLYVLN